MNDELDKAIKELIEAGVSDDEIKKFIKDYTPQDNGIGRVSHIFGEFNKGALGVMSGALKGIGESASAFDRGIAEAIGVKSGNVENNILYKLGKGIENITEERGLASTNPKYEEEGGVSGFLSADLPQGLGSTVPFMLATMAGTPEAAAGPMLEGQVLSKLGLVKELGRKAITTLTGTTGVMGGSVGIDQTFQEAKQAGRNDSEAFATAIKNYVGGATEALPLERILGRLTALKEGRGLLKALANTGKQMVSGGVEEGLQETLQQYWSNQVAKGDYDPDRDPLMGVLKSGGTAFAVGMLIPFAANIPHIGIEAKNKIIRSLQPKQTTDEEHDIQLPDSKLNGNIDLEYAQAAKQIEDLLEAHKIDLTKDVEDATVLPSEGNTEGATNVAANTPNIQPTAEPVQPAIANTELPGASPTTEPVANANNNVPVNEEKLYHTSKNEVSNIGDQHANGGIMHLWQKLKKTSIGLFTVAPSTNGQINPDSREDVAKINGKVEEANNNFPASKFGPNTYEIAATKPLKLLKTKDSGMDLHVDTMLDAARKSKDVNQEALEAVVKRTSGYENHEQQAALAAFLRTPEGGSFDGIQYTNKIEAKPKKIKATTTATEEGTEDQTYIDKADTAVVRYRASQVVGALEALRAKAEAKGLSKAVSHINDHIEKFNKAQEEIKAEKEKKKTIKEKPKKVEAPKKEPKTAIHKGIKKTVNVWKGYFYKKIGTAKTEYAKQLALDQYEGFRKENELSELEPKRREQLLKLNIKQSKASEKLSTKQSLEERDAAVKKIKEELGAEFGIDPETIEDVTFDKPMIEFIENHNDVKEVMSYPREEISLEEYNNLAPKSQIPILQALQRIVGRHKSKENTGLKVLKITVPKEAKAPGLGGFHFSVSKSDNSYIAVLVDEATGRSIMEKQGANTVLHEYIHEYTKMMFHRLYKTNKDFAQEINKSYNKIKNTVFAKTENLILKLINKEELTEEETDIFVMISTIMPIKTQEGINGLLSNISKSATDVSKGGSLTYARMAAKLITEQVYRDFYAFANPHEMMAEVFSDPTTVMFLSKIKMDETIQSGINKGEKKSLLYKWFETLTDWVHKKFEYMEIGKVANNALDHFMDVIGSFDMEFANDDLQRQANPGMFANLTPEEVAKLESGVNTINFHKISKSAVKTYRKIVNNLTYTIEAKKDMNTLDDVKKYLQGVNAHLPAGKKLDIDAYASKIFNKVKRIRKQRVIAKQHQVKLLNNARNHPLYKTSWKFKEDVDDMAMVNIDDLRLKTGNNEVMQYINGLGLFSINGILSKRQYDIMINYGKKLQMLKEVLPLSSKLHQTFMGGLEQWTNPATFSSIISKYDSKTAQSVLKVIYGGSMKSMAKASIEANNFFQEINKLAESSNFTHKDLAKIGLYGGIFSTVNAPDSKQWKAEVLANAQAAYEAAKNKKQAKEEGNYRGSLKDAYIQNEVDHAKEILDAIKKGKQDILTPAQEKLYNKIREFANSHQDDFERNSVGIWGNEDFQKRYNYFPTLAQGSINKGGQLKDSELIRDGADNLFEALSSDGSKGTYGYVYGKKVWSNYRRTNSKGYFYENDALAIAKKWSKSMLYDLYASKELKAINRVLEDKSFQKEFKVKTRDAFKEHLRSISGSANRFDPEAGFVLRNILKVRDKLYTAALATSGQILLQSSSGFAAAAVLSANLNPITSMQSFAKAVSAASGSLVNTSKLQKFLEKEGLGIQLRDILFEKYLSAEDYQNYLAGIKIKGLANKVENITEWSLRAGDKLGARLVWFAAYFNAGGTLENPSRDAALAAERMTGIMQNMSDMSFAAPAFKYNAASQKILMGMLYAFKSFSINAALNIWYSTRYSMKSKEARQVLAGQLGSILAYHIMAEIAIKPAYSAIVNGITGDGDDDDDKRVGLLESILTQSLWDLGIGGWTPSVVDGLLRYIYNKTAAPSIHGSPYEDYDQYMDSPIYSVKEPQDLLKDAWGPGFKDMAATAFDLTKLATEEVMADKFMEEATKAEKRGEKWEDFALRTIGTVYGGTSGMPLRGDVKRILEAVARKKKAKAFKEGKNKQSGQGEPTYAFPEYDLNPNF